jgi:hypothetical protein
MSAQGGTAARLKALETRRSKLVTDLPFKPSSPAKKGGFGYIKTNLGNRATGSMGEYKYAENVRRPKIQLYRYAYITLINDMKSIQVLWKVNIDCCEIYVELFNDRLIFYHYR